MAKQIIDFNQFSDSATSDTGDSLDSSVRPVADGEAASEDVLGRPIALLRRRTEMLKSEVEDLKYLSDIDRAWLLSASGAISWDAGTGVVSLASGNLKLRPFSAPQASAKAKCSVGVLTLEAKAAAYAGGNRLAVKVVSAALATNTQFTVSVTGTPARQILITLNSSNAPAINALVSGLNGTSEFSAIATASKTSTDNNAFRTTTSDYVYFSGGLDAQVHTVTAAELAAAFTADATLKLTQDGDTLAIWYDDLVNGAGGGLRESSGAHADVSGNLVNLRVHPERAPLAIPICTRDGTMLVFIDGTRIKSLSSVTLGSGLATDGGTVNGDLTVTGALTATGGASTFKQVTVTGTTVGQSAVTVTGTVGQSADIVKIKGNGTQLLTSWFTKDDTNTPSAYINSDGRVVAAAGTFNGQVQFNAAQGTAPFTVASDIVVSKLNASFLLGKTWSTPGTIGDGTPSPGTFTNLSAKSATDAVPLKVGWSVQSPTSNAVEIYAPGTDTNPVAYVDKAGNASFTTISSGGNSLLPAYGTIYTAQGTTINDAGAETVLIQGADAAYYGGVQFNSTGPTSGTTRGTDSTVFAVDYLNFTVDGHYLVTFDGYLTVGSGATKLQLGVVTPTTLTIPTPVPHNVTSISLDQLVTYRWQWLSGTSRVNMTCIVPVQAGTVLTVAFRSVSNDTCYTKYASLTAVRLGKL